MVNPKRAGLLSCGLECWVFIHSSGWHADRSWVEVLLLRNSISQNPEFCWGLAEYEELTCLILDQTVRQHLSEYHSTKTASRTFWEILLKESCFHLDLSLCFNMKWRCLSRTSSSWRHLVIWFPKWKMEDWEWDGARLCFPIQPKNLKSLGVTSLMKLGLKVTTKGEGHVTLMGTNNHYNSALLSLWFGLCLFKPEVIKL